MIAIVTVIAVSHQSGTHAAAQKPEAADSISPTRSPSAPPSAPPSVPASTPPASPPVASSQAVGSPTFQIPGPRPSDTKLGPVILVPGYGGDDSMLESLAARLHRAGRTTVLLAIPNDATGDLRGQADLLGAKVRALLTAGAPSVDLVGYSAGGVVVGLFVAAHPQDVRRIVTLGSPLHGTRLAQVAAAFAPATCPIACQQMEPGTSVLASLDAAEPARTGAPWLSIWTTHDEVVVPAESARFDGAVNVALQSVCADDTVDHIALPADALVAALTLRGLSTTAVTIPVPSECAALRAQGG